MNNTSVHALIIAPEITKGMKSLGSKALLKIKQSISVIDYQINELKKYNNKISIHIVSGFENDKIQKLYSDHPNINIVYNDQYIKTNQGESVARFISLNPNVKQLLVISNGVLFKNNPFLLSSDHKNSNSRIYCIDKPKDNFTIGYCGNSHSPEYLFFDLPNKWTECVMFNEKALSALCDIKHSNMSQMYLFEIINYLIDHHIIFDTITTNKKNFMKINNVKDITKAKVFI